MRSALFVVFLALTLLSCAGDKQEKRDAVERRPLLTKLRVLKTVAEQNAEIALVTGQQMEEPRRTQFLQGAELRYVRAQASANAIIEDVALALETATLPTAIDELRAKCETMENRFREFIGYLESESGPKPAAYSDDVKLITGTFTLIRELMSGRRSAAENVSVAKQIRLLLWRKWPVGAYPVRAVRAEPLA
ncbi:MAG: hypothetical protein JSR82_01865 [Verrucomicrobia bacterium]|nr:hypothetical protein [Verrucomicrobiota bacterium]